MDPVPSHLIAVFIGGALMFAGSQWYQAHQPPRILRVASPAKVLTKVERVKIPCETVEVFRPEAKQKIALPEPVRQKSTAHVVASTDVRGERDTRISTVLDTETGVFDTYDEQLALPWLRPESRFEAGLYYGAKTGSSTPVGRLQGSYEVLQIKGAHLGAIGSVDTDGEAFAGAGITFRW